MFEPDVLSQAELLARLTGLDPSEFQHVVFGVRAFNANPGGDLVLGQMDVKQNQALVITSVLIGSITDNTTIAGLIGAQGLPGSVNSFLPFFSTDSAISDAWAFLRVDGVGQIPEGVVSPFAFAGSCLHVLAAGLVTAGVSFTLVGNLIVLVARFSGFLCPVEAAEKLRAYRTLFFSSAG